MINKISNPSFKATFIHPGTYNNMSVDNRKKFKDIGECLNHLYGFTNDIIFFNNQNNDICYHIQQTHPVTKLLHPEFLKLFENKDEIIKHVNFTVLMKNLYNSLYGIKMPVLQNAINDFDNNSLEKITIQIIQDVEKFNKENSQKNYIA